MLGPASGEFAERIRDEIRLYRFGRQLELLKKAEKMAQDAGYTPKAVPIKILFPLLEGASLEENEDLHTMWAALLAHASDPKTCELVRPSFADLLKLMTPEMAWLLNMSFDKALDAYIPESKPDIVTIMDLSRIDLGTFRNLYGLFKHFFQADSNIVVNEDDMWHRFSIANG